MDVEFLLYGKTRKSAFGIQQTPQSVFVFNKFLIACCCFEECMCVFLIIYNDHAYC